MQKNAKIYVAGHNGMVGSSILRKLKSKGYLNVIYKSSKDLDLRIQDHVNIFISENKPDLIINAAAIVGGIWANNEFPYKFLLDNMQIQNNLLSSAVNSNIKNFIFLGSSCIYPKLANQPLKEEYLLTDSLESSNQWYAIAKISGVKLVEAIRKQFGLNYFSLMPTNLYGPEDNFDPFTSHVIPGMISKFHKAKINQDNLVKLWGDGSPLREFLHVDDLADAILFLMENKNEQSMYNIGSNDELSIKELANIISSIVEFNGLIQWNEDFPNGSPRKKLDSSRINKLGWYPKIGLVKGIEEVYNSFAKSQ